MSNEALWVQDVDIEYSAAEDRRLIGSAFSPGVIDGLELSTSPNLSEVISPGRAVIADPDNQFAAYLVYFTSGDAELTKTIPASATNRAVYVTVNASGLGVITSGSAPATPYLQIGTVTSSGSQITSVTNTTARATPPAGGAGLPLEGGVLTGALQVPSLYVYTEEEGTIIGPNGIRGGFSAPNGIALGGAGYPTKRHYLNAVPAFPLTAVAPTSPFQRSTPTYTTIAWSINGSSLNIVSVSDYPDIGYFETDSTLSLVAPVAGSYILNGRVGFSSASNTANWLLQAIRFSSNGTQLETYYAPAFTSVPSVLTNLSVTTTVMVSAGDYFRFYVAYLPSVGGDAVSGATSPVVAYGQSRATLTLLMAN